MRRSYLLTIILFCSCTPTDYDSKALQLANDSLAQRIVELEQRNNLRSSTKQVAIANTSVEELPSQYVDQIYQIKISYPKSYFTATSRKFPVLYVLDAETNFGAVSYIVQRLIKDELIPEILVVGIAFDTDYKNFYQLRSRDLTPVEDQQLRMGNNKVDPTGGAPAFSQFLEKELFPFIEQKYKVDKTDRAIYGHSYGGLFGCYALMDQPQLFNRYLILGPSLWFKNRFLVKRMEGEKLELPQSTKLYMSSGEFDKGIQSLQTQFANLLQQQKLPNLSLKSEVMENETHRTIFGIGFTNGLRFLYEE